MNRAAAVVVVSLCVCACQSGNLTGEPPVSPFAVDHRRADDGLHALLLNYWNGPAGGFDRATLIRGVPASYWNSAQAFDALIDAAERTHGAANLGLIETFYRARDARGAWSAGYYDDESWMVLALTRAYDLTLDARYFTRARGIFDHIIAAWDTTCCGTNPGGIWWDVQKSSKATASNGGPAIAAARLYVRTRDAAYLEFARKVYAYWRTFMVDPVTFRVTDSIRNDGQKNAWLFTYNEGLMLGAAVELHRATGEERYRLDAHGFAHALVTTETRASSLGAVLSDGAPPDCQGEDCPLFKGIAYRYLALLQSIDPRAEYAQVLETSARAVYELAREEQTGRFGIDWAGPASAGDGTLAQHVSGAFALNGWAQLRGLVPNTESEAFVREAEDAVVEGMSFVSARTGFTSWGGVSGTGASGERVTFDFFAPTAGAYALSLRYATRQANVERIAAVDGMPVTTAFPAVSGSAVGTVELSPTTLNVGRHSFELIVPDGGSGALDVDALTVKPAGACSRTALTELHVFSPGPGHTACGTPQVCWGSSAGAERYSAVVDGTVTCESKTNCCTPKPFSPGWHQVFVQAHGPCETRSSVVVAFFSAPPPSTATPMTQGLDGGSVLVTWPEDAAAVQGYDVFAGSELRCAAVSSARCVLNAPAADLRVRNHGECALDGGWQAR